MNPEIHLPRQGDSDHANQARNVLAALVNLRVQGEGWPAIEVVCDRLIPFIQHEIMLERNREN
jgi:hypothetical protein